MELFSIVASTILEQWIIDSIQADENYCTNIHLNTRYPPTQCRIIPIEFVTNQVMGQIRVMIIFGPLERSEGWI